MTVGWRSRAPIAGQGDGPGLTWRSPNPKEGLSRGSTVSGFLPKSETMKTSVFVSFCLFVVAILLSLHALIDEGSGPQEKMRQQLTVFDKELERAHLRSQLVENELADLKSEVATVLPEVAKKIEDPGAYPVRQLASVVANRGDVLEIERASTLFERAKGQFREKDFEGSNQLLKSLLSKYPDSVHGPEAYFLLAEGHYQLKHYPESVVTIERMIETYPENELTGFALLRLGSIFELQDRYEDASDIYSAVIANFRQPDLLKQASLSLKAVKL